MLLTLTTELRRILDKSAVGHQGGASLLRIIAIALQIIADFSVSKAALLDFLIHRFETSEKKFYYFLVPFVLFLN